MRLESTDHGALFRDMAAGYDAAIRVFQPSYEDMLRLSTDLARVAAPGHQRCLDYGTGTGAALAHLAAHFDEVVAVDPARTMLAVASARVARDLADAAGQIRFIEGTSASPELLAEAEGFDAIHCSLVMMFVEGHEAKLATLRALRKMLRSGGVLIQTELLADESEHETFSLWRSVMRLRGATEEQVATGERQIAAFMYRCDAPATRALLEAAGFTRVTRAYQSLHTAIFVAVSA